jgi:hypothetical protein
MPGYSCNGRTNRLLDVLANPPIIFFFEIANGNNTGAGANSKFCFGRRPTYEGCGTVDTEENERRFVACWRGFPDKSIAVCKTLLVVYSHNALPRRAEVMYCKHTLRTGDYPASTQGNIYACNSFVVALQFIL